MKRLFMLSLLGAAFVSAPSLAQTSPSSSNPSITNCGTVCPGSTSWTVGGQALFGGVGESTFVGTTGANKIAKWGEGGVDIKLNAAGCGTIDCQNANSGFDFRGFAREKVTVETMAQGNTSGLAVSALNQGTAIGVVNFTMQRQGPTSIPQ